jgi:diguanylate cyclase (GGDEF)-like protein
VDTLEYNVFRARPDATVLRWQSTHRLWGALALSIVTLLAQAAGALRGSPTSVLLALGCYGAIVRACSALAAQRMSLTRTLVAASVMAELAVIFFCAQLILAPMYWPAMLLACVLSLQLATYYHDRAIVWLTIVGTVGGYLLLVSGRDGVDDVQLWLLSLYLLAAMAFARVQRRFNYRVARIVQLFAEARAGHLDGAYDVRADDLPDGLTLIGDAYNRLRAEIDQLLLTDGLSGCVNLRGYQRAAERAVSEMSSAHAPLALIALDIDHFKSINDECGHLAGDAVISETGALLLAHVRAGDVVARLGGEEFGILMPDASSRTAEALAQRLVGLVRNHRYTTLSGRRVTMSAGVAVYDHEAPLTGTTRLRSRADAALYLAKRHGRDRVCVDTERALVSHDDSTRYANAPTQQTDVPGTVTVP